jgi:hypothetical protein
MFLPTTLNQEASRRLRIPSALQPQGPNPMTSGTTQSEVGRLSVTNSFFQRVLAVNVKEPNLAPGRLRADSALPQQKP